MNASWRCDAPDWSTDPAQAPLLLRSVVLVDSWSGYAASVAGVDPAWLVLPAVTASGHINLSETVGTWSAWFSPYWTSQALGGGGPGRPATLFEVGAWSSLSAVGWWSLQVAPDGNSLAFVAMDGAERVEIARGPVVWRALDWHHVTLTYSALKTRIYVDGKLLAVGPGVALVPLTLSSGARGFALGSDALGGNLAQGQFDEVALFGVAREAREIAADYVRLKDTAALGPVTAEEQAQGLARLLAQAEAAARGGAAAQTIGLDSEPCEELKVFIERIPPGNHQSVRLRACGRKPGVIYTWWSCADLPSLPNFEAWDWAAEMGPGDDELLIMDLPFLDLPLSDEPVSDLGGPRQFFRLVESPHFYVSAQVGPGGDGSRDLPFASLEAALGSPQLGDGAVIVVLPGIYRGPTNINLTFGGKDVALLSEQGWETTIIDAENAPGQSVFICNTASQHSRGLVHGLTIRQTGQRAVHCSGGSRPRFANCAFTQNSATGAGGAVYCDNANPTLVNCRFIGNTAASQGGAIYATGVGSLVRVSHCTFRDNARQAGGGTLCAVAGARMEVINSIVWSTQGAEIVTASGGEVAAVHCDIAGEGIYPGRNNINQDPLWDNSQRLTLNSPCIDRGTNYTFQDCQVLVRYDMDGEARLDQPGADQLSQVDIGADEFLYRLPVPMAGEYSQVDEASGVVYLGNITVGQEQHAKFAVIDDEVTDTLYIYELDADGLLIPQNTVAVNIRHPNRPDTGEVSNNELNDLEGITFDEVPDEQGRRHLYIVTSQNKRNRYRNVEGIATDPLLDPPSNDYDRRRTILMRLELDANLNPIPNAGEPTRVVWESENLEVPYNTDVEEHNRLNNGLISYIRGQLDYAGSRYRNLEISSGVLIAWNTVNKFGTPVNGETYFADQGLPYAGGGPNPTAGTVLGDFPASGHTPHSGLVPNTHYYYRIWAFDAEHNYYALSKDATNANNGIPVVLINEFEVEGGGEHLELYNPSPYQMDISGWFLSDDPGDPEYWSFPAGRVIPGRGCYLRTLSTAPTLHSISPTPAMRTCISLGEMPQGTQYGLTGGT